MKEHLTICRVTTFFAFARRDDGSDVYVNNNEVRNLPRNLYVGAEVWALVEPSKCPGKCPIARNLQFGAPSDHLGELPANLGKALGTPSDSRAKIWEDFELAKFEMGPAIEN